MRSFITHSKCYVNVTLIEYNLTEALSSARLSSRGEGGRRGGEGTLFQQEVFWKRGKKERQDEPIWYDRKNIEAFIVSGGPSCPTQNHYRNGEKPCQEPFPL